MRLFYAFLRISKLLFIFFTLSYFIHNFFVVKPISLSNDTTNIDRFLQLNNETSPQRPTIFCIILTQLKNLDTKAKAVYTSWAHQCTDYRFISLAPGHNLTTDRIDTQHNNSFKLLKPEGLYNDTYRNLTYKVLLAFEDVFQIRPHFDWYLKADDDTFIFYDNLHDFLSTKNPSIPVTFGYDFNKYDGYHSGGAGYLVSNEAMSRLVTSWRTMMETDKKFVPWEDIYVARLLRKVGTQMQSSLDDKGRERFHCLNIMAHYNGYFPEWLKKRNQNPLRSVRAFFYSLF